MAGTMLESELESRRPGGSCSFLKLHSLGFFGEHATDVTSLLVQGRERPSPPARTSLFMELQDFAPEYEDAGA
jgi:hypothetical protein